MSDGKQCCRGVISNELSEHFAVMSFVSSILIVALHSLCADKAGILGRAFHSFVAGGLCQVAIPWFFFASGFFLAGHIGEERWWSCAIQKRIRTLLVPFWIWSLIICIVRIVFAVGVRLIGYDYHGADGMSLVSWSGLLRVLGLDYYDTMPTMWYLRTLFVFVILSPLISRINSLGLAFLFVVSCCFDIVTNKGAVITQLGHNLFSVRGLFYFSLGLWARRKCNTRDVNCINFQPIIAIGGIILCVARVYADLSGYRRFTTFLSAFQLPCLTYCIYLLCSWIKLEKKWTSLSFPIYVTHLIVILCITAVYGVVGIGGSGNLTLTKGLLRFIVALGISIVLCLILRKAFPGATKIMFGGR